MFTAQELYFSTIKDLPPDERLRLAALILQDLTQTASTPQDAGDFWREEDVRDLIDYSLQHAATSYPEEEDLV